MAATETPTTTLDTVPGRPPPALLAGVLAVVSAVVLALPVIAGAVVPERVETVAGGAATTISSSEGPIVRFAPPAGWDTVAEPSAPNRPFGYRRGGAELLVHGAAPVASLPVFAERQLRLASGERGLTARPVGRLRTPAGFAGTRYAVSGPGGRRGEIVVLGRGDVAVGLWLTADAGSPADLAPVAASLRLVG